MRGVSPVGRRGPHAARAQGERAVGVAILTVSDTRRGADDLSGAVAQRLLEKAGHVVTARAASRDSIPTIRRAARTLLRRADTDAVFVTGGTGVALRDVTPEALEVLVDKSLPGFGEHFRRRSERQVGAAAWMSRAGAGVASGRLLVWCPGSTRAVELALRGTLLPELAHVIRLLGRFEKRP